MNDDGKTAKPTGKVEGDGAAAAQGTARPRRMVPPVPPPAGPPGKPPSPAPQTQKTGDRPDPTRFGDWEKNGRCIDF